MSASDSRLITTAPFFGFPYVIDPNMEYNTWTMHDGTIFADRKETIERGIDDEFLTDCGIEVNDRPKFVVMPDVLK